MYRMKLLKDEKGQGLVEYGLLLVLIIAVVVASITLFGNSISDLFFGLNSNVESAAEELSND